MTIRDAKSGTVIDVDDDGRRLTFEVPGHCDSPECTWTTTVVVSFDKAELRELLKGR